MNERDRLLKDITAAIEEELWPNSLTTGQARIAAQAALSVIERKGSLTSSSGTVCTCGNDGYSSSHGEDCPLL